MKIYRCDKCKKIKEVKEGSYPKDWYIIKIYSTAQSKGGKSKGYHLCNKCKEEVFGK